MKGQIFLKKNFCFNQKKYFVLSFNKNNIMIQYPKNLNNTNILINSNSKNNFFKFSDFSFFNNFLFKNFSYKKLLTNKKSKKNFSTDMKSESVNIFSESDFKKLFKSNSEILNNLISKLTRDDKIKEHEPYLKALSLCRYVDSIEFSNKSRVLLLNLFRKNEYEVFKSNIFSKENFTCYFSCLYFLELQENDIKIIEEKFLEFTKIFSIQQFIEIFDNLFYYDLNNKNLKNTKKFLFEYFHKNYFTLSSDSNNIFNSNLIFMNSKEISIFSSFGVEKLLNYTNINYMPKVIDIEQRLMYLQPLPKLVSEIHNSTSIPKDIQNKILVKCSDSINNFLKNIKHENLTDSYIYIFSNTFLYGKLNDDVFEIYLEDLYKNLSTFDMENLIEIFFLILNISKFEPNISFSRIKLFKNILQILSNKKIKPKVFLDVNKFFVYLNMCRINLNEAIKIWLNTKDIGKMEEKELDLFNSFNKILKLSIDVYPFATKDLVYTDQMLEELYISYKKFLKLF